MKRGSVCRCWMWRCHWWESHFGTQVLVHFGTQGFSSLWNTAGAALCEPRGADFVAGTALCEPPCADFVAGAIQNAFSRDSERTKCCVFPECVAKGSRLTLGGLGVEPCSRSVVSTFATVRNRSQPSATVRNRPQPSATVRSRALRRCHWWKLLQVTMHGCVTCEFATRVHCDLREKDMSRKKRDAFRCTGAAFREIRSLRRSSIGISVWRVVFLGCWMWPCHWDLRFRVWHRSSVFVTSLS